jgi:PAS domain S-box-containing protein
MNAPPGEDDAESQLRNLADNLPGGMVYQMLASAGTRRFLFLSRGVEDIFGVAAADALVDAGRLYERILPEFVSQIMLAEQTSLAEQTPFVIEVAIRSREERIKWIRINSAPRLRADGCQLWDGMVLDITQQKQADLDHQAAERRLDLATSAANIGIWDWDLTTGVIDYSPRAREIVGFSPDQTISFNMLQDLTEPEDLLHTGPAVERALDPDVQSDEVYQYRIRRYDTGELRWILAHGSAIFAPWNDTVRAVSYVGTIQDVTESHAAEAALRASEQRLRLAIGAGRMAVWELDIASDQITPSPELNQLFGFPPQAQKNADDFRSLYAPGEGERIAQEGAEAFARGASEIHVEPRIIWPDGTVKWLAIRAQIECDDAGTPRRAIGIAMDITKRREAEDRVKLVARELQHRVKNSLAVVQTIASQTFRRVPSASVVLPDFTARLQALASATDILTRQDWSGAELGDIIEQVTRPYRAPSDDAFTITGPSLALSGNVAIALAMGLHELSTNALKYGALSVPEGRIALSWRADDDWLELVWRETGGPVVPPAPQAGFGIRLLQRGLLEGPNGHIELTFQPEGVVCKINARLNRP